MLKKKNYYVGLDVGTNSAGLAVTDPAYHVLSEKGKAMWLVRLFNEGKTAEERRVHRTNRRRVDRSKQRVAILDELFKDEISKIDFEFFMRLQESKFCFEDKKVDSLFSLFNDTYFTDKEYYEKYPTIYHLRAELATSCEPHDVRLVYLAIHHLMKKRGHFLFDGETVSDIKGFVELKNELLASLQDSLSCDDLHIDFNILENAETTLRTDKMGITAKKEALMSFFSGDATTKKQNMVFCTLLAGGVVNLTDLFINIVLGSDDISKIQFQGGPSSDYESNLDEFEELLGDDFGVIESMFALYSWGRFAASKGEYDYISQSKVASYAEHKQDLQMLKSVIKRYDETKYGEVFKDVRADNYCAYVGKTNVNNQNVYSGKVCDIDTFCKYLNKVLGEFDAQNDVEYDMLMSKINNRTILPKQVVKGNSYIPYQVNFQELQAILNNASNYLPFLLETDSDGISVKDKISKTFTFKVPYYVGPLNKNSEHAWVVRSDEKIYPWNFDNVVDAAACAEKFINRMTNKCSCLLGEDVLPMDSLIYRRYCVLNELNPLKINGNVVSVDIKQMVFEEFFVKTKLRSITKKSIKDFLVRENLMTAKDELSGIDSVIKSKLNSYHDFKSILDRTHDYDMIEDIIKRIVVFPDDRSILKKWLIDTYSDKLTSEDINRIVKLRYKGWGRLSKKLLTTVYTPDKETGEAYSIMDRLYNTNDTLMVLLSKKYDFYKEIEYVNANFGQVEKQSLRNVVKNLYCSPAVKKSVLQTMLLLEEVVDIMGCEPSKVFVEVAKGELDNSKKGKTTDSRFDKITDLYNSCKNDVNSFMDNYPDLIDLLSSKDNNDLRIKKLYYYFMQMGRCMYSGEKIDIKDLFVKDLYDIDHIYPKSKIYDDSFDNTVLVRKDINGAKSNVYPINSDIRLSQRDFWNYLLDKGFVSKKKFDRLVRSEPFTTTELTDFINRQLVETRQSTKLIAELISNRYPETEVVYVKAHLVSEFRHKYDMVKSREINDLHHAKDAYLNIVVGNVFDVKFTKNPANYINDVSYQNYDLTKMYDYDVARNGVVAWNADKVNGTIATVKKYMRRNNILFTKQSFCKKGQLFDINVLEKGKGQVPIKSSDERYCGENLGKYGAYNGVSVSYFAFVEYKDTKKKNKPICYRFIPVELHLREWFEQDPVAYCEQILGLSEPVVLVSQIKINTLINIDGFYAHITGKTGDKLGVNSAIQLLMDSDKEKYLTKVIKYVTKVKADMRNVTITINDKIDFTNNLLIYDFFVNKLLQSPYAVRLSGYGDKLIGNKDLFENLSIELQCQFLFNVMNLFSCNATLADLSLIGGSSLSGNINIPMNFSNKYTTFKIINQSVTGLYSSEIDLIKLVKERQATL